MLPLHLILTLVHALIYKSFAAILTKYILESDNAIPYPAANSLCNNLYGTTLASIHTERDNQEAIALCDTLSTFSLNECWIGLSDKVQEDIWKWEDQTTLDFTGDWDTFSWSIYDEDCVVISNYYSIYEWHDYRCEAEDAYPICNKPSMLCNNKWQIIISNSNINDNACEKTIDGNGENMIVNTNTKWEHHETMIVEYMFSILSSASNGHSGLLIDLISICQYVYVGISVSDAQYKVFIARIMDGEYVEMNNQLISYIIGDYYLLSISVTGALFEVRINDIHQFTQSIADVESIPGYIGILNNNVAINAKYLYVSGTEISTQNDDINCQYVTTMTPLQTSTTSIQTVIEKESTGAITSTNADVEENVIQTTETFSDFIKKTSTDNGFFVAMAMILLVILLCIFVLCVLICCKCCNLQKPDEKIKFGGILRMMSPSRQQLRRYLSGKANDVKINDIEMAPGAVVEEEEDPDREEGESVAVSAKTSETTDTLQIGTGLSVNLYLSRVEGMEKLKVWFNDTVQLPYYEVFVENGFEELSTVSMVTMELLEAMGIKKVGHRIKLMLCIDRLKESQNDQNTSEYVS